MKSDLKFKPQKSFSRLWRSFMATLRSRKDRPARLRHQFRKDRPLRAEFTPEMEKILNKLIRDTVGTGGALDQEFLRYTAQFDKSHPIGEKEARTLLMSLLKRAIANRDLINGRIEHAVEYGSLYNRYYAKLQNIYDLTVQTNIRREEMAAAQQDYFFAHNVYQNVRDLTYSPQVTQQHTGTNFPPPPQAAPTQGGTTT